MSRTIRRKGKDVRPDAKDGYTLTDSYVWVYKGEKFSKKFYSDYGIMPIKRFPLPEKEYWKGYWRFHGDNYLFGHTKLYRDSWGDVRTKNRNNLVRHLREDTECFFWEDVNTQEWD